MSWTTEPITAQSSPVTSNSIEQNQFDLPVKEFMGYDPKGTRTVTGTLREAPQNPAHPNTVEDKGAVEAPAPAESVTLSPQVSALARKEAAQRQREFAFKQREKALESKLADAERFAQLKAKIASKDYSAADELGLTYEEYTQYLLKKQAGEKPEELRFRKQEEEIAALKKAQEDRVLGEYQANQALWKQEISKLVSENEAYSTIDKELKFEDKVLQHINDSFEEDGTELTADQAAQEIEDYLVQYGEKFASLSKVQKKFQEQTKVLGPPKANAGVKTITQNMTTTPQKSTSKPFHLMSESEQLAEAIRRVNAAKLQR